MLRSGRGGNSYGRLLRTTQREHRHGGGQRKLADILGAGRDSMAGAIGRSAIYIRQWYRHDVL